MSEEIKRHTAYKVWIADIVNRPYEKGLGEFDPNYVQIQDKKVSRVNIIATVIAKQEQDTSATVNLDDGTAGMQAIIWDNKAMVQNIKVGATVIAIGKVREFNNQRQIALEIIRELTPEWRKLREEELKNEFTAPLQQAAPQQVTQTVTNNTTTTQVTQADIRKEVLQAIETLDTDDGADFFKIVQTTGKDEELIDATVQALLKEGEIFEVKPGKLRSMI